MHEHEHELTTIMSNMQSAPKHVIIADIVELFR